MLLPVASGFAAAAATNILGGLGVILLSRDNCVSLNEFSGLFGIPGFGVIGLWGLAYLALFQHWRLAPFISLVFAIEKMYFVVFWIHAWLSFERREAMRRVAARDPIGALFLRAYGLIDGAFAIFFAYAFIIAISPDFEKQIDSKVQTFWYWINVG